MLRLVQNGFGGNSVCWKFGALCLVPEKCGEKKKKKKVKFRNFISFNISTAP